MLSHVSSSKEPTLDRPQIPKVAFCEDKARLLDKFLKAIQQINFLHYQQTQAVIRGDADFSRFDALLYLAQDEKEKAKYAWISHVESHQCGG
jgi:hypothetical protein